MVKKKTRRKVIKPPQPKLDTVFNCYKCGTKKTIEVNGETFNLNNGNIELNAGISADEALNVTFTVADDGNIIVKSDNATEAFGKHSAPSFGIYHFTDGGETTWYDFACEINRLGKKFGRITQNCTVNPCTTEEYGANVERPAYSVLSKDKICHELKIKLPPWQTSLEKFIKSDRFKL